jgi:peroxiredoxin (alkyl hydroperoxide reductase subunit C)
MLVLGAGENLNGEHLMPLPVGSMAPNFTAPDERDRPFTLSEHLAYGNVLLIFYPADWGFICRNEVVEFRDRQDDFERCGIRLVGYSTNMVVSHGVWSEHLRLRFPLISDPPGRIALAYGVLDTDEDSFNKGRTKRALFLMDRSGIVRYAWVTENQWQEPDYDRVLASCIEALARPPTDGAVEERAAIDNGSM